MEVDRVRRSEMIIILCLNFSTKRRVQYKCKGSSRLVEEDLQKRRDR